ncbi:MAG: type II secretion system protein GspD [Rhodospirillaceae bacterium]|nr:type II secretion system protein GspD [Rhodospirillaceae bacterium]MBT5194502.1 type II secretion system protein GspD [Rhodospirillaceae bacterium]MBT5897578.1 type II secretion system protein GspD [Rhodospirillaceae bacterium]MBT7757518.1 type II secretion system protein GspD [Rhodospirillaceae bacterium]
MLAVMLTVGLATSALAQEQKKNIPWQPGGSISRTSVDDDIRSVLRSLLQASDLSTIFRPGVSGTISLRLDNVVPREIFNQIIVERGLDYEYNPASRTVTIFPADAKLTAEPDRAFITLENITVATVRRAVRGFGMEIASISYDQQSNTISVIDVPDKVTEFTKLIKTLEGAATRRRQRTVQDEQDERQKRRAKVEAQLYEDLLSGDVKVIPLRYASVGATTREFHGRTVTVPGIGETLKAILGNLNINRPGPGGRPPPRRGGKRGEGGESEEQFLLRVQELSRPFVSIDPRTNSVIVRGTPKAIAGVERVLRDLDQPLRMIEIEVIIATAQLGVAEELGIRWRGAQFSESGDPKAGAIDTGTGNGQVSTDDDGISTNGLDALSLLPVAASPSATIAAFVLRGTQGIIQAQLRALAEENKAQILSAPRIVTLQNITARITRSQDLFVQVDTGGDNGQGLETIQTGLTLEITPSIIPARQKNGTPEIRLSLTAVNSAPGAGSFGQIDVRSQEVQTEVLVPNGGTYVIGGLFDDNRIEQESGVPGLKDLPLFGALFRTNVSRNQLGETIFFITPRVIEDTASYAGDIAVRMGSAEYIRQQRRRLDEVSRSAMQGTGAIFPNALHNLEEDE